MLGGACSKLFEIHICVKLTVTFDSLVDYQFYLWIFFLLEVIINHVPPPPKKGQ
jgi:hypothetical protein